MTDRKHKQRDFFECVQSVTITALEQNHCVLNSHETAAFCASSHTDPPLHPQTEGVLKHRLRLKTTLHYHQTLTYDHRSKDARKQLTVFAKLKQFQRQVNDYHQENLQNHRQQK